MSLKLFSVKLKRGSAFLDHPVLFKMYTTPLPQFCHFISIPITIVFISDVIGTRGPHGQNIQAGPSPFLPLYPSPPIPFNGLPPN